MCLLPISFTLKKIIVRWMDSTQPQVAVLSCFICTVRHFYFFTLDGQPFSCFSTPHSASLLSHYVTEIGRVWLLSGSSCPVSHPCIALEPAAPPLHCRGARDHTPAIHPHCPTEAGATIIYRPESSSNVATHVPILLKKTVTGIVIGEVDVSSSIWQWSLLFHYVPKWQQLMNNCIPLKKHSFLCIKAHELM